MMRFGTAGIRGPVERVTPALALAVGQAAGRPGATFVVGRDGRETGPALAAAMEAGLESAGASVRRLGVVPTPTLAFASQGRHGVMLTASHNPPADNGIKLFADGVEYDREAERAVESALEAGPEAVSWDRWGHSEHLDVLGQYRRSALEYLRTLTAETTDCDRLKPLDGRSVAVDCGTGVSALVTPQILERLGAEVVALNATVDGHFPARESKPTPETLADFSAFLAGGRFDLGVAHDGDGDRLVVLDSHGEVVHEDTILAVIAAHYTSHATVEDPVVVTTPNASGRIDERVRTVGGRVERIHLGALHEGIARVRTDAAGETAVVFAAEPWKHIHPAFGGWIDAPLSAGLIAILTADAGTLEALRDPVTERPYRKVAVTCPDDRKKPTMETLETTLPAQFPEATVDTSYGIRLEFPDASWLLVRPSGTEPYVRLYAESDEVDSMVAAAQSAIVDAVGEE